VVRAGDSLWSIAAQTAHAHGVAGQAAVGAYWWRVVTANRAHLPDPDNPDLLFPGDLVRLPPI
jgi:nucleoid-associated protein YgaU